MMPDKGGPGILVLHSWWGLNTFFKFVCDQLAERGFTAVAPDLHQGQVAKSFEEARAQQENFDSMATAAAMKTAHDFLLSLRPGKTIGVIGFSLGAAHALNLCAISPGISAAAFFYGVGQADFSKVQAKVLGHFAEQDPIEPAEQVRQMEPDMRAAGVDVTIHTYPAVGHWFLEQNRPEYDSAAARLA